MKALLAISVGLVVLAVILGFSYLTGVFIVPDEVVVVQIGAGIMAISSVFIGVAISYAIGLKILDK